MFKRKTVFVIGAGGSADFEMPLGDALKGKLATAVNLKFDRWGRELVSGSQHIVRALDKLSETKSGQRGDINPYRSAGVKIADGMPLSLSIDNFLQTHSEDKLVVEMGKLGIAHSIVEAERSSTISRFKNKDNGLLNFAQLQENWLTQFVRILLEGVKRGDSSGFQNVEIVTFNYDRIIEEYLQQAIANQWLISTNEAIRHVSEIKVTHIYGTVGNLPWQLGSEYPVAFGANLDQVDLNKSAAMLRTFSEDGGYEDIQQKALKTVEASERIVFIGFSFMSINMKYFLLSDKNKRREVIATAWGLSYSDRRSIGSELANLYLGGLEAASWENKNILMFEEVKGAKLLADYARILAS